MEAFKSQASGFLGFVRSILRGLCEVYAKGFEVLGVVKYFVGGLYGFGAYM